MQKKQWILLWHNQLHGGWWLDYKVFSMCGSLHSKFIVERKNKWIKRWCTTSDTNTSNRQLTNVEPIFKLIFFKTISFALCAIETNAQRNITWLLAIFFSEAAEFSNMEHSINHCPFSIWTMLQFATRYYWLYLWGLRFFFSKSSYRFSHKWIQYPILHRSNIIGWVYQLSVITQNDGIFENKSTNCQHHSFRLASRDKKKQ